MAALCRVAVAATRRACCSISAPHLVSSYVPAASLQGFCSWEGGEGYTFPLSYEPFEPNEFVFLRVEGVSYGTRAVEVMQALNDLDIPVALQDVAVAVQPRDWRVARYFLKVTPAHARAVRALQRSHPYLMKLNVEQASYQDFMRSRSQFPAVVGAPAVVVRGLPSGTTASDILRLVDGQFPLAPVPTPITVHSPLDKGGAGGSIGLVRCWDEETAGLMVVALHGSVLGAGADSAEAATVVVELAP